MTTVAIASSLAKEARGFSTAGTDRACSNEGVMIDTLKIQHGDRLRVWRHDQLCWSSLSQHLI